jgi:hypothetical protein
MDKKSRWLWIILVVMVLTSIGVTFIKTVVFRNFDVVSPDQEKTDL